MVVLIYFIILWLWVFGLIISVFCYDFSINIFNEFSFNNFDNFLNDCKHFFINILVSLTCVVLIKVTWFYIFVVGVVHMKPVNNDVGWLMLMVFVLVAKWVVWMKLCK